MIPAISVIIPTFNRSSLLVDAITSVIGQTFQPLDIIVVDDGSTDDTPQIILKFGKSIRYIKTANRGVSAARNRGVVEAKGEWLAFLDSDDTWSPRKLELQFQCLGESKSKVCFCASTAEFGNRLDDIHLMDPELSLSEFRTYAKNDCRIFSFPRHPFIQSMLIEKSALIQSGSFDESLVVAEDTKLIYKIALNLDYTFLNMPLVVISRNRGGPGLSDTMDSHSASKRYSCYARVQSEAYKYLLELNKHAARIVKKNMKYFQSRQAELACALHQKDDARRYALASISMGNGITNLARSILILAAYPIAEHLYTRKWNGKAELTLAEEPHSADLINS
jgi:glycosyltransferase involved in cell wall biosynthesis